MPSAQDNFAARGEPGADPVGERRLKPRFRMFGRVARIDALGDSGLCHVENISDFGMMVDTSISLNCGDPVRIALDCCNKVQGRVVWQRGSRAGIRFLQPVESSALIRKMLKDRHDGNARPPRLSVRSAARVTTATASFPTFVGNISQGGMSICHAGDLAVGAIIDILLENGASLRGIVRWSTELFAGVEFCAKLPVGQLASVQTWTSPGHGNAPLTGLPKSARPSE